MFAQRIGVSASDTEQGFDDRVAGNIDIFGNGPFVDQVLGVFGIKNKMQVAQGRDQPAIDFLRIGIGFDKCALSRPDVADRNFIVKSRQRPYESGGALWPRRYAPG